MSKIMTDEEFFENMKYAIVAVQGNKVMHFCGYMDKPTEEQFAGLDEELQSDPEFNLIGEDYDLYLCPPDLFEKIMADFHAAKRRGEVTIMPPREDD
jgi:hypothetical protein